MPPRITPLWTLRVAAALLTVTVAAGCELPAENGSGSGSDPTGGTTTTSDPAAARKKLDALKVVTKTGSMRGYSRAKFPHWNSTGSNCDVRDTVLKRDGTKVKVSGCNVVAGTWISVYDGDKITDPAKVDIDHVVPLANAWRSGAAAWTTDQREKFANDLDDPQLVAVSAASNRSKGDQDPSTWKPEQTGSWCQYAQDWIVVKSRWKLTVTTKEKVELKKMLEKCR
ncbi:HNH endonuclease family protein [Actinoplanes sp. CA-051413]|uniref:HNH endonuclease family protein n=1 Tax=Actinoplanes sp. CA-051413 TaxID=3239899 RepID=UPI003D98E98E